MVSIVTGFRASAVSGIISLILSPIFFFLSVVFARIYLEVLIVFFRIAENTGRLVELNEEA
ncbi:MAG: DUF4282 domain-containing protein [Candidatus Brocadiia bacterium]